MFLALKKVTIVKITPQAPTTWSKNSPVKGIYPPPPPPPLLTAVSETPRCMVTFTVEISIISIDRNITDDIIGRSLMYSRNSSINWRFFEDFSFFTIQQLGLVVFYI